MRGEGQHGRKLRQTGTIGRVACLVMSAHTPQPCSRKRRTEGLLWLDLCFERGLGFPGWPVNFPPCRIGYLPAHFALSRQNPQIIRAALMRKTRRKARRRPRLLSQRVVQTRVVGEYSSCSHGSSTSQITDKASVSALAGALGCKLPDWRAGAPATIFGPS